MAVVTYLVRGMTCGHCQHAVSTELKSLDGVTDVSVELDSGRVTVASEQPLDEALVREAVDEAGYVLAGVAQ